MPKHIVISGTYSTGKTTTTTALALATGIPLINALSAREILTDLYPGRKFQEMNVTELIALGLKRFEERIHAETELINQNSDFISDGSVLNEWIYGTVRLKVGINPGSPKYQQMIKAVLGITSKRFLRKYLDAYGQVVKQHAKKTYTEVIHLPIEFDMKKDGHRPVSEKYRKLSDREIQKSFENFLEIPVYIVGGSQIERLTRIIDILKLPQVMSTKEAIEKAEKIIKESREAISKQIIEQYEETTLTEKIKILSKY